MVVHSRTCISLFKDGFYKGNTYDNRHYHHRVEAADIVFQFETKHVGVYLVTGLAKSIKNSFLPLKTISVEARQ